MTLIRSFGACGPFYVTQIALISLIFRLRRWRPAAFFYVTQKAQISQKAACGLVLLRRFQACGLLWIISRNILSRYTATNEDTSLDNGP